MILCPSFSILSGVSLSILQHQQLAAASHTCSLCVQDTAVSGSCVLSPAPLGCKGSSGGSGRPPALKSDFSLHSVACVQHIYVYICIHKVGFAGLNCKRRCAERWSPFWFRFVFLLLSHEVEGSCSFCNSIRSHSCPEMSLPGISPLVFHSCYGSRTHHL